MEQYFVIIEKGKQNFSAYSPDILGCVATGKTIEETMRRMRKAIVLHLQDMYAQGESLPHAQGMQHAHEIQPEAGDLFTFVLVDLQRITAAFNPRRKRQQKAAIAV